MIRKLTSKVLLTVMIITLAFTVGCEKKTEMPQSIILATTTSTEQTGLLDAIIPTFTEKTGIEVKVVAVGTGQALEMGKNGEADVVLVHAKTSEEAFVEEGYGIERFEVMYNDFVLLGIEPLPEAYQQDIMGAFDYIAENQLTFISRGDDSGTHKKELGIWAKLNIEPSGDFYISVGKGMGEVIQMADEKQAYTLSDRGTYLSMKGNLELEVVVEKSSDLLNQYGIIVVNPEKNPNVHQKEAQQFVDWMLSSETQEEIGKFGVEAFGQPLFVPNAKE